MSQTNTRFGRKPGLSSGKLSVSKMVSLREDEWNILDTEAKTRGLTRSELIRRCVTEALFPENVDKKDFGLTEN